MKYFVPSLSSVLAMLVVALAGFCLLQREELEYVRGENQLLVQQTLELDDLRFRMGLIQSESGAMDARPEGSQ
jgi:hypothetical protein